MRNDAAKIFAIAICLLTAACYSRTESTTTSAPKPEVWGAILPVPPNERIHINAVFETPDRDIIISYSTFWIGGFAGIPPHDRRTTVYFSFSKGIPLSTYAVSARDHAAGEVVSSRMRTYERILGLKYVPRVQPDWRGGQPAEPGFADGSGHTYFYEQASSCPPHLGHTVIADQNNQVVSKKAIVRVARKPQLQLTCVSEQRHLGLYRVIAPVPEFHALSDGTILMHDSWTPLTIRLRADLTSPFLDESDEVIMVDADQLAVWVKECRQIAQELYDLYHDTARRLPRPDDNDNPVPHFETTDTCLALRLVEKIGEKRARAAPPSP